MFHFVLKGRSDCPECGTPSARRLHARVRQRRWYFDAFRREYNELRPHEALGDETPASVYRPLPRLYPTRLPPLEYPAHFEVRRVSRNGGIRWHKRWVNVGHVLGGEYVGFTEIDDGEWDLYFGPLRLGRFHEPTLTVEDALGRLVRRKVLPMSLD